MAQPHSYKKSVISKLSAISRGSYRSTYGLMRNKVYRLNGVILFFAKAQKPRIVSLFSLSKKTMCFYKWFARKLHFQGLRCLKMRILLFVNNKFSDERNAENRVFLQPLFNDFCNVSKERKNKF
jgi:hypothetical protein